MQHAALDRSTDSNRFIRVDVLAWLLAEELLDLVLYFRHAGLTADQNHVGDIFNLDAGILQCSTAWRDGALDQVFHQGFELGTGDLDHQVFRTSCICSDVRQVDFGLLSGRKLDLGFFCGFLQALFCQQVVAQVQAAVILLEFISQEVDQAVVEVFATEEGVTVGGQHFELVFAVDFSDFNDGDVESAAAEVIDRNLAVAFLLVHAESQCGSSRLVDDAFDFQAGDTAGILGRLTLAVVEVGRNRDNGFGHFFTEVVFGSLLHLAQYFSRDLRRRHFLAAYFHPCIAIVSLDDGIRHQADVLLHFLFFETTADQALDCIQRVLGVGDGLTFCRCASQNLAIFLISDDGRCGACAFGVFNHARFAAFHDGDAGIGGAQVNTDNFAHYDFPLNISLKNSKKPMFPMWG